mmetsp:Transcript_14932/g.32514  ORF Transcript_14932/g.32514 Transcript_14932/m.32514 type:complete len:456 (+) Transcript_14932:321-1688(+)
MSDQQSSSVGGVGEGQDGKRSPLLAGTAQRAPAVAAFPPPPRNLEEEGPTMRSVAILSAPVGGAGPIGLHRGHGLHVSKPAYFGAQQKSPPVSVIVDKSEVSSATVAVSKWSVGRLDSLPDDFPLERTSRRISTISGSVVAARINDCLVTRSIEAVYNDVEAKAKCRTSDYVSFRIRLFSDGEDGVVVEVQRRRGSSFNFMKDCRAILDAAEGRSSGRSASLPTASLPALKPVSGLACLKGVKIDAPSTDEPSTVVKDAEDLLKQHQRDTNMLGMQNLEELTNPLSTSQEAVRLAARSVVSEDSSSTIRGAISSLLEFNSLQSEQSYQPAAKDEKDFDYDERMHNLSLSVVYNALSAMEDEGSLSQHFKSHESWFHDTLIPVLVRDVESAKDRPHDACMAAKCIHCLAGCAPSVRESIMGAGALHALAKAKRFGAGNHASLAEVVERATGLLKCQ